LNPHQSATKQHIDRFSRFAQLVRAPNTQTDTQTTLSVAIDRIYAMRAGDPDKNQLQWRYQKIG